MKNNKAVSPEQEEARGILNSVLAGGSFIVIILAFLYSPLGDGLHMDNPYDSSVIITDSEQAQTHCFIYSSKELTPTQAVSLYKTKYGSSTLKNQTAKNIRTASAKACNTRHDGYLQNRKPYLFDRVFYLCLY